MKAATRSGLVSTPACIDVTHSRSGKLLNSLAGRKIKFTGHACETPSLVEDLMLETPNSPAPAWMKQGRATGKPRARRPPTELLSAFHCAVETERMG
jgi:hypothetical protein